MSKKQSKISVEKKVKTIEDYLSKIKGIQLSENIFYRGHSDKSFQLIPSIYRKESLIKNEHLIYRETISKVPYDFNGKSTIESLVLMQHYGIPTRILDLTTNALVALYFACADDKDDGEVIIFDIPQQYTCYFDSDRVTILANLAKCDDEFYYTFGNLEKIEVYKEELLKLKEENKVAAYDKALEKEVESELEKIDEYSYTMPNEIKGLLARFDEKKVFTSEQIRQLKFIFLRKLENMVNYHFIKEEISTINEIYFGKLLHYIKEDKSYFLSIINPKDIANVFAIKPKLDNPRIVRQQGAFLIFGTKQKHIASTEYNKKGRIESIPQVPSEWIIRRIEIDAKSKEEILRELSQLGIDKSTLFPEIDKIAEYIKERYEC